MRKRNIEKELSFTLSEIENDKEYLEQTNKEYKIDYESEKVPKKTGQVGNKKRPRK